MGLFRNLKTSVKILTLIVLMAFFLGVVGYAGHYAANNLSAMMSNMYKDRLLPIQWLNGVRAESRLNETLTLAVFLAKDPKQQQDLLGQIQEHKTKVEKLLADYSNTQLDSYEAETISKALTEMRAYRDGWQKSLDLALQGQQEAGHAFFVQNAAGHLNEFNKLLDQLVEYNSKQAEAENETSDKVALYNDRLIMTVTLLAVLFSLVLGWVISRLIALPLANLVTEVKQLAAGDLKIRQSGPVYHDEIGQLTSEVSRMADNLRNLVSRIHQSAEELTASSEELTAGADQAAKATGEVTGAITQVAQGAQEQSMAIDETTRVVLKMSGAIEEIASHAGKVSEAVGETVAAAEAGAKSADSVAHQMDAIETTVSSSASAVTKLGERSQEIGQIVDTIAGIAGQTNLLALNAAIEAARAGEQGRGFAVVAEEVRKLAEQSQEAAGRIAAMIRDVQSETAKAVAAMEAGSNEVKVGADVVASAGKNFEQIGSLVDVVSAQVTDISAALEEMASSSQQIVASVKNIDEIGKRSASKTQHVSAASEEHAASIEEIAASSQSLATMAETLQATVSKFKV
ncbi:MAG: methyl-accepting chemotaxis protein [Sporomusaceae bacterium]|nr:methyl-accepting chemotaxis protein [Sporomusaceae bacterium]